jgi:hypothetical protein
MHLAKNTVVAEVGITIQHLNRLIAEKKISTNDAGKVNLLSLVQYYKAKPELSKKDELDARYKRLRIRKLSGELEKKYIKKEDVLFFLSVLASIQRQTFLNTVALIHDEQERLKMANELNKISERYVQETKSFLSRHVKN